MEKSELEKQVGIMLDPGKIYMVRGTIEKVFHFEMYHVGANSRFFSMYVPKAYHDRIRLRDKYRITFSSVEIGETPERPNDLPANYESNFKSCPPTRRIPCLIESTESVDALLATKARNCLVDRRTPHERLKYWKGKFDCKWRRFLGEWIEREIYRLRWENALGFSTNPGEIASHEARRHSRENQQPETFTEFRGSQSSHTILLTEHSAHDRAEPVPSITTSHHYESDKRLAWAWVAGFFDGEGCVALAVGSKTIGFEATIAQSYRPTLELISHFLKGEGISHQYVTAKKHTVYVLCVYTRKDVEHFLAEMFPFIRLKRIQTKAALDYLADKISGNELVQIFNGEVTAGRRSGKLRELPDQPLKYSESLTLSRKIGFGTLYRPLERLRNIPEE